MTLADKIIHLRKKQGWSQEELAEKLDVTRQSVSKWEGGLSVPDLNKIVTMSGLFGVSTDFLLKDECEPDTPTADEQEVPAARMIDVKEASTYLDDVERISLRMALAVALCILSPVCLIVLGGLADAVYWAANMRLICAIGMVVLLGLVGGAVALFIPFGIKLSQYAYLDEPFTLGYGVREMVEKKQKEYLPRYTLLLTVGIVLRIVSAIPLIALGSMGADGYLLICSVGLLLVMCAVGVFIIVRACYISGSHQRLLQVGEFSVAKKREAKKNEVIDTAYWSGATAIYLLISFLTEAWHLTWILWPAAACLYPAFLFLIGAIRRR